jgi:sigma-54 dependent transcriptional regulator, acetoin dehydrogenase operon transcriptional activator AcoR
MRSGFDLGLIERHHRAREAVMRDTGLMPAGVDPAVVRGWQRCLTLGIEPDRAVVFQPISRSLPRALLDTNNQLKHLALNEVHQLARALSSQSAVVVLADSHLSVIHADGLSASLPNELHMLSRVGVDTSERSIGSNALSIAAAEMSAVTVLQNAHFCSGNAIFSCAGAPIRTPSGQLVGVLDVTTAYKPLPGEALFLTAAAARAIENNFFRPALGQIVVRCHPRAEFVSTPMAALLLLSEQGDVIGANETALGFFGLRWPLRGVQAEQLFETPWSQLLGSLGQDRASFTQLVSANGMPVCASIEAPSRVQAVVNQALAQEVTANAQPYTSRVVIDGRTQTHPVQQADRLADVERLAIEQALQRFDGNIAAAARSLGVSRGTLYRRLRETK